MSKGFDTIELIELGFKQKKTDVIGDYYLQLDLNGLSFITRETFIELGKGELFTLIALADYEETRIENTRDLQDIIRIFGKQ
jgi:hypothetical protein